VEQMIAYCGLVCTDCPAHFTHQKSNDAKRNEVAKTWSKEFKVDAKAEEIAFHQFSHFLVQQSLRQMHHDCEGCTTDGNKHFYYCNICKIRKCAREKVVANCAHCDSYACETLSKFFQLVPEAKTRLDRIKNGL
jgi:hypothetical protein